MKKAAPVAEVEAEFLAELQELMEKWGGFLFVESDVNTEERMAMRLCAVINNESAHSGKSELSLSKPFVPGFAPRIRFISKNEETIHYEA